MTINCNGTLIDLSIPVVMGILNITQDSFYAPSRVNEIDDLLLRAQEMINDGATIIDIGAMSSRPGAEIIEEEQEWATLEPVIKALVAHFPNTLFSVDTIRASVARKSIALGFHIINDISGGELDKNMFQTVADLQVPYICMHMQGTPENMQNKPTYSNLMVELQRYFAQKIATLRAMGVKDIILDPGIGFGKTIEQNMEIIQQLEQFTWQEVPILVGASRKSFIYKYLNVEPEQALNGTTVINTMAVQNGAHILRVHDVKEAIEVINLLQMTSLNKKDVNLVSKS